MDTSSLIHHRFNVEIPRGKLVKITSILKRQIHEEIMTSIRWGNFEVDSTFKIYEILMSFPRGFFYVVSTSNRRNFWTCCFHSMNAKYFPFWEPILSEAGIVLDWCNLNDCEVITDIETIGNIFFGNFPRTQIIMNKDNYYLLQSNANQSF